MTLHIALDLRPDTEAKLRDRAAATGKDVGTLVREAVEQQLATVVGEAHAGQGAAEFDRILDEFFAAHPDPVPALPRDFSRADIYADHD